MSLMNRVVTIDNRATWWITWLRTFPRHSAYYTRPDTSFGLRETRVYTRNSARNREWYATSKRKAMRHNHRQTTVGSGLEFLASHRWRSPASDVFSSRWNSPGDESSQGIELKSISKKYSKKYRTHTGRHMESAISYKRQSRIRLKH